MRKKLAIVGGGPSALFLLRRLVDQEFSGIDVEVFEGKAEIGPGFPYSRDGADYEHVTNVSGNEIPGLTESLTDWIKRRRTDSYPKDQVDPKTFSDYRVLPRLLFGEYLSEQFDRYIARALTLGIEVAVKRNTRITRLVDQPEKGKVDVYSNDGFLGDFDYIVVATGHHWPVSLERKVRNHFDSPYPPSKLLNLVNIVVNIKGSSLTAIDAVKTIARANGTFVTDQDGKLVYVLNSGSPKFRINMHSRHAMLPGLRFHLEDPHLSNNALLSREDIQEHRRSNGGFVSLDYIFEKNFKEAFRQADPAFFELIRPMSMEEFVASGMSSFTSADPFELFAAEYAESLRSIRTGSSEYWKEKLAILSVAMNYPAKYLSAQDKLRFDEHLMPLISVVIAFVPQSSAAELLALHDAGVLFLDSAVAGGADDQKAFVDCTGQPHLWLKDFIFQDLVASGSVSQARLKYQGGVRSLDVPGLAITDAFRAITSLGQPHSSIFIMAVPYIGGFNPDYSGLDFCEEAAKAIVGELECDLLAKESPKE